MLDRYYKSPYNYQSKIGYDTLIQKIILKELLIIIGTTITELHIELIKWKLVELNILKVYNYYAILFNKNDYNIYHWE